MAASPIALTEFLARVRARGLGVGLREQLAVGRLLERFDDPDLDVLCAALTSLVARNPAEAAVVREEFHLCFEPAEGPPVPPEPVDGDELTLFQRAARWIVSRWRLRWITWAAVSLAVVAIAGLVAHRLIPDPVVSIEKVPPIPSGQHEPDLQLPTPPPVVNRTREALAAGGAAVLAFLVVYGVRTRREAGRRGRAEWAAATSRLPRPRDYPLNIGPLSPPLSAVVLDDVATLLGRRLSTETPGRTLDVERTLDRTLRAGLAPHFVLRAPRALASLVVLEDVSDSMHAYAPLIAYVLDGLSARGVPLERWRFDTNASRVWRASDGVSISLKQLTWLRSENAVLIVSDGLGVLDGRTLEESSWVPLLRGWRSRAWLHPAGDPSAWHAGVKRVPCTVRPLTEQGLFAAARDLIRAEAGAAPSDLSREVSERPVVPLDVERMSWLLTVAQRYEPELGESLRQRFAPEIPRAAVAEALHASRRVEPLQVGPDASEVHAFMVEILNASRPDPGSFAFQRWQLERAAHGLYVDGTREDSLATLATLAAGPAGPGVEDRLSRMGVPGAPSARRFEGEPLPKGLPERLRRDVIKPIARRARRSGFTEGDDDVRGASRWVFPTFAEVIVGVVAASLVVSCARWMGPLVVDKIPPSLWLYDLSLTTESQSAPALRLAPRDQLPSGSPRPPNRVDLYRGERKLTTLDLGTSGVATYLPKDDERGASFHAQASLSTGTVALSQSVPVPALAAQQITRPVPDVRGMLLPKARALVEQQGLRIGFVKRVQRSSVAKTDDPLTRAPAGTVFGQHPAAGTAVAAGTAIDIDVLDETQTQQVDTVPSLIGKSVDIAAKLLASRGMSLGRITDESAYQENAPIQRGQPHSGIVVSQDPAAGQPARKGLSVNVVVRAQEASEVVVPKLIGLTLQNATTALMRAGLQLGAVHRGAEAKKAAASKAPQTDEVVVDQQPAAGTRVRRGSAVDVVVRSNAQGASARRS